MLITEQLSLKWKHQIKQAMENLNEYTNINETVNAMTFQIIISHVFAISND